MAEKRQYTQFPHRNDGVREYVDKDKVKQQYMESSAFSWKQFCQQNGYEFANSRRNFPVRSWREEKLNLQVEIGDETLIKPAYAARMGILRGRLKFPKKWGDEGENSLQLVKYYEAQRSAEAQHDIQHAAEIAAGKIQPKFKMKASELRELANAKLTLMELHRASLLVNPGDAYASSINIKEADPQTVTAEVEGERLKSMGVSNLRLGAVTQAEMTQMLNKWVDQAKGPENDIETPPVIPENAPLTPMDEDDEA